MRLAEHTTTGHVTSTVREWKRAIGDGGHEFTVVHGRAQRSSVVNDVRDMRDELIELCGESVYNCSSSNSSRGRAHPSAASGRAATRLISASPTAAFVLGGCACGCERNAGSLDNSSSAMNSCG